ncbi:MAG: ATP phosphoribosyltransferase regulatory subunit, partial [Bacilli bacterium]
MQSDFVERPSGTRDYVGCELTRKRAVEDRLIKEFELWGYQPVETPLFEYAETIARGLHRDEDERLLRLFDREGRTIALRPEMTTPVARVATTLLASETLPLRLCYCAETYSGRSGQIQGPVEVTQAGVELIGDSGPDADAEIIALMVSGLRAVGLTEFRFALGHMGFVQALFSVLAPALRSRLRRALIAKDLVSYDTILASAAETLPADWFGALQLMPRIRGGVDAIAQARSIAFVEAAQQACNEWQELLTALSEHGVADVVHLDL